MNDLFAKTTHSDEKNHSNVRLLLARCGHIVFSEGVSDG
jgi:hypothetical protein